MYVWVNIAAYGYIFDMIRDSREIKIDLCCMGPRLQEKLDWGSLGRGGMSVFRRVQNLRSLPFYTLKRASLPKSFFFFSSLSSSPLQVLSTRTGSYTYISMHL